MKRPVSWHLEKQRTAKALRELPACATMGCTNRAIGTMFGSDLCAYCVQRHRNEKTHFVEGVRAGRAHVLRRKHLRWRGATQ